MPRIKLSENTWEIIPEGRYIFQLADVKYDEDFGKLEITLRNNKGKTHKEKYSLLKSDGSSNDGAIAAFTYLARKAMQDDALEEVDPLDLVDRFIECDIEHTKSESTKEPGKMLTFAHIKNLDVSDGWNKPDDDSDLDDLLGL